MQKPRIIIALIATCLLAPLGSKAQEELPAPPNATKAPLRRPAVDPRDDSRAAMRAERRQALLNIGGQVLNALAPPEPGTPGAQPPIDIGKLNSALGPLVTALLGGGQDIESLRIGFDPKATNFAEDRLRLGIDASLRRTAWAEAPSQLNASLGAQVVQNDGGGMVAVLDGRLRMHTSTVALANYALVEYKKRAAERATETPPAPADAVTAPAGTTTDEIFSQLLDERLARVDRLDSLDDVADLMTAISGLRLTAADQRIEQLRGQVRSATDPASRQDLSQQLAAAREQRDKLFDVRPRITRGTGGTVHTIAFDMIGSEIFPGADIRQMEFRVQENDIWIQASGALTRWVELYPVVKPLVMGVLQRIQNGDPRALDAVRPFVDGPIGRGRAIIMGRP